MKFTYQIEAEAISFNDEKTLEKLGFVKEWDNSPYTFNTDNLGLAVDVITELDQETNWEWKLSKKEATIDDKARNQSSCQGFPRG